jgi:hypothetical protein
VFLLWTVVHFFAGALWVPVVILLCAAVLLTVAWTMLWSPLAAGDEGVSAARSSLCGRPVAMAGSDRPGSSGPDGPRPLPTPV